MTFDDELDEQRERGDDHAAPKTHPQDIEPAGAVEHIAEKIHAEHDADDADQPLLKIVEVVEREPARQGDLVRDEQGDQPEREDVEHDRQQEQIGELHEVDGELHDLDLPLDELEPRLDDAHEGANRENKRGDEEADRGHSGDEARVTGGAADGTAQLGVAVRGYLPVCVLRCFHT